ncbi:hypothetical protein [Bacillus wiedmannii]|uniref:hypothetical protein n=1 Tax=Bacillus wiedmannii TaxID=1890302 RepID=UPI000BF01F6C|nr:hypothetical protein [Bacillus wiedmannii]MDP1459633.1 hypothetical protein [Bacillus wiedmannii]PEJ78681.1 hypothetical protein CN685_05365 [Bacillus wiedmannii]
MGNNEVILWNHPNGISIPAQDTKSIQGIVGHAYSLKVKDQKKIITAFDADLYDMASEYVWKRTMGKLKVAILSFGIEFVMEMLGRNIDNNINPEDTLSEVDVINLAADLGVIDKTARLLFLQQSELLNYFAALSDDTDISYPTALHCVTSCVQYVLAYVDETEIEFSNFRDQLYMGMLTDNTLTNNLNNAPYFYRRTTVRTMLNLIKSKEGGELDNALHNFTFVIPELWGSLTAEDKWPVGAAYAEAVSKGQRKLSSHIKSTLMKVKGFDYVPESLRSNTFISAANELLKVHYEFNNFYTEPDAAKNLANLGTIPSPALGQCLTAVLVCRLGNIYGESNAAQSTLEEILGKISDVRWEYYLNEVLPVDQHVLYKLLEKRPFERWKEEIVIRYNLLEKNIKNAKVKRIIDLTVNSGSSRQIRKIVNELIEGEI